MNKFKMYLIIILIVTVTVVTGCSCKNLDGETAKTSTSEESEIEKLEEERDEYMELISVERLMEIYDFTEEELGDFNLEAYILEREITEKDTESKDHREIIELYMELGINLGYNITKIIYPNARAVKSGDDLSSMKWMVLDNAYNMGTVVYIWDIENMKSYYAEGDILYDYSKADVIKELSDEEISNMVTGLENIGWNEWGVGFSCEDPTEIDYYWNLYVVLENGQVANCSGIRPEDGTPEGFYEWLQMVIEISEKE